MYIYYRVIADNLTLKEDRFGRTMDVLRYRDKFRVGEPPEIRLTAHGGAA